MGQCRRFVPVLYLAPVQYNPEIFASQLLDYLMAEFVNIGRKNLNKRKIEIFTKKYTKLSEVQEHKPKKNLLQ